MYFPLPDEEAAVNDLIEKIGTLRKQEASNIVFTLSEAKSFFFYHVNTYIVKVEPRKFTIFLFSDHGIIN